MNSTAQLKEIALVFFKLGCFAFGGPAAHIAMMEQEIVLKRKWMTSEHFLDLMGATNLIPGPNSTEMTMHCGYERGGWKGLFIAGACFIFPAVVITGFLAFLYQQYGQLPEVTPFISGIKPAVIALIVFAGYRLGKKAIKSTWLGILGIVALGAYLYGLSELIVLLGCGLLGILFNTQFQKTKVLLPVTVLAKMSVLKIFLSFLKIGSILYGSGYVLFAFLNSEFIDSSWLTQQQLLDAVAVGQFTPGPVLSTATFIGWQLNGFWGAIAATAGIFLPSFLFVLLLNPLIPKMRKSKVISNFLSAVNIAAVALIAGVCIQMSKEVITDWRSILIALISLIIVFFFKKINSMYVVVGGAVLGWLLSMM